MAYLLHGRAVRNDRPKAPCIFCGRWLKHLNDGGTGQFLNGIYRGKKRTYVYCCDNACPQRRADDKFDGSIWRCGCVSHYVENVGEMCGACEAPREKPAAVSAEVQNVVHVYNLQVYSKRDLSDSMDQFIQDMGAMLPDRARITQSDYERRLFGADDYGAEDWFKDDDD